MKKVIALVVLIIAIFFFPVISTNTISGSGQVLTPDKEPVGNCDLSVEIKEIHSLALCYSKRFSFILDGKRFSEFDTTTHAEADGLCFISQQLSSTLTL